jgi:hypothetical protein
MLSEHKQALADETNNMKALLPHIPPTRNHNSLFDSDFYWFAPCHICGVYVASGIFNQVEHSLKFHRLKETTEELSKYMELSLALQKSIEESYDECILLAENGKLMKIKDMKEQGLNCM